MSKIEFYSDSEELSKLESLEKYKYLLEIYKERPTLKEALLDLFANAKLPQENANELYNNLIAECTHTINKNYDEIKKENPSITKEDALIISSYTYEPKTKYEQYRPYSLLNKNMVSSNRKVGVKNIDKYLLIFLLALRKLKRTRINTLYRCITSNVKLDKDINGKNYDYQKGNKKIFWPFTSASNEQEIAERFLKDNKWGTKYILKGENLWGKDISLFNVCGEKEILLMPEMEYEIENIKEGEVTEISCKLLKREGDILLWIRECPNCGSLNNELAWKEKNNSIHKQIDEISKNLRILIDSAKTPEELADCKNHVLELQKIQLKFMSFDFKKKCLKCNKEF